MTPDAEIEGRLSNAEKLLDQIRKDPVHYGVPRNYLEWFINVTRELQTDRKRLLETIQRYEATYYGGAQ